MPRLHCIFALAIGLFLAAPLWSESPEAPAATLISFEGTVSVGQADPLVGAELGQLLGEGDRIVTGEASGAHLVLADGSSLVLGANSEVSLRALGNGGKNTRTLLQLARGLINLMVEKQATGSDFEVQTDNASAAVKGTDFEVAADTGSTQVTVNEGEVHLSDPAHKRFVPIRPLEQARLFGGRLERANALSKREAGEFRARWERARVIHGQRWELMKIFMKQRRVERKKLRARLAQARRAGLKRRLP